MSQKYSNKDLVATKISSKLIKFETNNNFEAVIHSFLNLNAGDDIWDFLYPNDYQITNGYRYIVLTNFKDKEIIKNFINTYVSSLERNSFFATRLVFIGDQFTELNELPVLAYDGISKVIGYKSRSFIVYPDFDSLKHVVNQKENNDLYLLF